MTGLKASFINQVLRNKGSWDQALKAECKDRVLLLLHAAGAGALQGHMGDFHLIILRGS